MASNQQILRLQGSLQHYAWGKPGATSAVASLFHDPNDSTLDKAKPYAGM